MKKKSITINAILNMSRTFMNLAFPLITYPYITRVLGVENIGKYNFASSIVGYLSLISIFGISSYAVREGAIVRDSNEKISDFVSQMVTIGLMTTAFAYIIMLILSQLDSIRPYRELIFIQSIVMIGNILGSEWINTIYEDFAYVTARTLLFQIISIILMFLFVKSSNDLYIYAVISVVASAGGYVCNFFHNRRYVHFSVTKHVQFKRHFPRLTTFFFSNLTTTIFVNSDQTMLGLMCGDYYVGIYAIAVKIYNILKNIFTSILFVVMPRVCVLEGNGDVDSRNRISETLLMTIMTLVLPMAFGIFMIADKAVLIVAGSGYIEGSSSLRILAMSIVAAALSSYMTYIYIVPRGYDKILLISSTVSAIINVLLNFVLIPAFKHNGAAITTLVSEVVVFGIEWIYVKPDLNYRRVLTAVLQVVIACVVMMFGIGFLDKLSVGMVTQLILEIGAGILLYYIMMLVMRNKIIVYGTKKLMRGLKIGSKV